MLPLPEKPHDPSDISDLTLEQQFAVNRDKELIEKANLEQLKKLYLDLRILNYRQANAFRQLSRMPL